MKVRLTLSSGVSTLEGRHPQSGLISIAQHALAVDHQDKNVTDRVHGTNNPPNTNTTSDNAVVPGVSHSRDDASILRSLIEAENKEVSSKSSSSLVCVFLSHAEQQTRHSREAFAAYP